MTGYHTRWARPQDAADDPERIAIREALAFGKALYDIRTALGLTVAELAMRAAMTDDDIERIEEGGTEPTIPLLRRLAAALNADVRLTGGHDLGSAAQPEYGIIRRWTPRRSRRRSTTYSTRRSCSMVSRITCVTTRSSFTPLPILAPASGRSTCGTASCTVSGPR